MSEIELRKWAIEQIAKMYHGSGFTVKNYTERAQELIDWVMTGYAFTEETTEK